MRKTTYIYIYICIRNKQYIHKSKDGIYIYIHILPGRERGKAFPEILHMGKGSDLSWQRSSLEMGE